MRRALLMRWWLALLSSALCFAEVPARAQAPADDGFVRVRGVELELAGVPLHFLGANVSVMHGPREREQFEAVLDAVAADGLKVVRVWALGEQVAPGLPHHPLYAFRIGENGWIETSFAHLDRVLAAAAERKLKVIVVLANRWKDYGGIATYLRWGGAEVPRDAQGEPLGSALSAFFRCAPCQALYRDHVTRIVTRRNSIRGVAYRDDPTIMAWELINEASAVSAREEEALLGWVRDSARLIRSLDPRHLISAGHVGYQTARERRVWRAVQSLPEIDFADAHFYPLTDPRVARLSDLPALLDDAIALARLDLQKPLIFGEFGFDRASLPKAERERWFSLLLRHAARRGVSGALVWQYEPRESPTRAHTIHAGGSDLASERVRSLLREAALAPLATVELPANWSAPDALPRFAPQRRERGTRKVQRPLATRGAERVWEIDPADFARAQFERAGVYAGHALETVWGAGEGSFEYRFAFRAFTPARLTIEARISSELPGASDGADFRDGSDVEISVDDVLIGTVRAKPDDGLGEVVAVELSDARLLRRLSRARIHTLRFRALPSAYAGGLCIYGEPTGAVPLPEGAARPLTHVRITASAATH